ncbi:MAG TPA: type VI secretion system-associated protein TagF [Burkholderiaceae bacterium]
MKREFGLASIACFGKLPSSGDFVRSAQQPAIMDALDAWLAQSMTLLADDPRWKARYDTAPAVNFVIAGPRRGHAIAGRIHASRDRAGRRYPLLLASVVALDDPARALQAAPVLYRPLWDRMASHGVALLAAADAGALLNAPAPSMPLPALDECGALCAAYAAEHQFGALGDALAQAGYRGTAADLLLALAALLKPVAHSDLSELGSCLRLPLPLGAGAGLAAAWYLQLIGPMLQEGDLELALLFPDDRAELVLGFAGASPQVLCAALDPAAADDTQVDLFDSAWAFDAACADPDLQRLSCYLGHRALSLQALRGHFLQCLEET